MWSSVSFPPLHNLHGGVFSLMVRSFSGNIPHLMRNMVHAVFLGSLVRYSSRDICVLVSPNTCFCAVQALLLDGCVAAPVHDLVEPVSPGSSGYCGYVICL